MSIKALQMFRDQVGDECYIITPDNTFEDILFHLAGEINGGDPEDGIDDLEDELRVLRQTLSTPSNEEGNDQ